MRMVKDAILNGIAEQIQRDLIKEMGETIDKDTILEIAESQFAAIADYMKNSPVECNKGVRLTHIGVFRIKEGRIETKKRREELLAKGHNIEEAEQIMKEENYKRLGIKW